MMNERRISFRLSNIDNIWCPTIRTILCFQLQNFPSFPSFLGRFRLLRVLDAVGGSSKELPSQVFELIHLRYLVLICTHNIPSAICNLVNLQTLIIFPSFLLNFTPRQRKARWNVGKAYFTLPLVIWRIPQLRHLFGSFYMLPHPLDRSNLRLENLQTLSRAKDLVWNEEILQMIPNVKKLGLVYQSNEEFHLHLLKHLYQLEKLEVYYGHLRSFSWQRQNPSFPGTLKKLTLVGGGFPWKDMGIIGSLPNLQVLKLINHACNGETWKTADEEFPHQLRYLLIDHSSLRQWITQSSHFPRLNCLVLRLCEVLREIPGCVGEIPTLELLEVDHCNKSLVESAEEIKEDQQSYGNYALQVRLSTTLNSRAYQCTTDDTFLRRR